MNNAELDLNAELDIETWLASSTSESLSTNDDIWEPGFDVDRQIVHRKLGPYTKFYPRPENFIKRFYHVLYPLPIEEWQCTEQVKLYDDFCTLNIILNLRFQATFNYALRNMEIISQLNEHIKTAYHGLVIDLVNRELLNLSDGAWVHNGLEPVEKKICSSVCEMLLLQNIQSQVTCRLKPNFDEFPDVHFAKEAVYLSVLKKNFEFKDQQKDELFRQQQEQDIQKIEHKRKQLKQINDIAEVDRQRLAIQAENNKLLLKEKEQQQLEQFEIKKRIHADKVKHNRELQDMAFAAELKENEIHQQELRKKEEQEKIDLLVHQAKLKEKELEAEIAEFERKEALWRIAKDKIHGEELELKHRQKQIEFDTDVGYKKRYEIQRLAMQEESFTTRKKADIYLKREIELLELEKRRLALEVSIKDYKDRDNSKTSQKAH